MGSWLDRMARRAASTPESTAPTASPPSAPANDSSRRGFLKKAAVVTGAAWSVPVLQSVVAPAYAASGGAGSDCSTPGEVCTGDGSICNGAKCGGLGADCGICAAPLTCGSGKCGGAGATCSGNGQCQNNNCVGGYCGKPPGQACTTNGDCRYNNCINSVCGGVGATCTAGSGTTQCANSRPCSGRTGGSTTCGGPGATCSNDNQCTYGNCNNGCGGFNAVCQTVGVNTPCADTYTCKQNGANIRCRS